MAAISSSILLLAQGGQKPVGGHEFHPVQTRPPAFADGRPKAPRPSKAQPFDPCLLRLPSAAPRAAQSPLCMQVVKSGAWLRAVKFITEVREQKGGGLAQQKRARGFPPLAVVRAETGKIAPVGRHAHQKTVQIHVCRIKARALASRFLIMTPRPP